MYKPRELNTVYYTLNNKTKYKKSLNRYIVGRKGRRTISLWNMGCVREA